MLLLSQYLSTGCWKHINSTPLAFLLQVKTRRGKKKTQAIVSVPQVRIFCRELHSLPKTLFLFLFLLLVKAPTSLHSDSIKQIKSNDHPQQLRTLTSAWRRFIFGAAHNVSVEANPIFKAGSALRHLARNHQMFATENPRTCLHPSVSRILTSA